jgi:hypothetical protein
MIGRGEDVADLARTLGNGINTIVTGPRRTGKTTVCAAAVDRLRKEGTYTVSVDLFRSSDAAGLAQAMIEATIRNRSPVARALHAVRRAGSAARKSVEAASVWKLKDEFGDGIEVVLQPGFAERDPQKALEYAFELPQRIAEADDKRVVLFFDEFQEITARGAPYGDVDLVTKRLRSILQRSPSVTSLFAGSVEHLMRGLFGSGRRAFFQFGGFYELTEIDARTWMAGLRDRFAEDGCELEETALSRLVELGELHPRATMLIAQHVHDVSVVQATRSITGATIEIGYRYALAADRPNHELTISRVRDWRNGPNALAVARRIARAQPVYGNLNPGTARRAVGALRDAGLIERSVPRGWRITDPFLRRYLEQE